MLAEFKSGKPVDPRIEIDGNPGWRNRVVASRLLAGVAMITLMAAAHTNGGSQEQPSDGFFGYDATYQNCSSDGRIPVTQEFTPKNDQISSNAQELNTSQPRVVFELPTKVWSNDGKSRFYGRRWKIVPGEQIPDTVTATLIRVNPTDEEGSYSTDWLDAQGNITPNKNHIPVKCVKGVFADGQWLHLDGNKYSK